MAFLKVFIVLGFVLSLPAFAVPAENCTASKRGEHAMAGKYASLMRCINDDNCKTPVRRRRGGTTKKKKVKKSPGLPGSR